MPRHESHRIYHSIGMMLTVGWWGVVGGVGGWLVAPVVIVVASWVQLNGMNGGWWLHIGRESEEYARLGCFSQYSKFSITARAHQLQPANTGMQTLH